MSNTNIKAKVHWFDNHSQEGMIRLPNGEYAYINNDPCHGYLLNGGEFRGLFNNTKIGKPLKLESGQDIIVSVFDFGSFKQVTKIEVL